jgi:broad specificity phosphatase PhoE
MVQLGVLVAAAITVRPFYFVRHGETLANATGHYSAATVDTFSPKGRQEVRALTGELLKMPRFDMILVSPSPRAIQTIAPYLVQTRQRAYVWPLLYECCTGRRPPGAKAAPFGFGSKISIPKGLEPYFVPIPGETRFPNAPSYNEGLGQVNATVSEFNRLYRGRNVLLVGHSGNGGHFLHELTGKWIQLKNAELHKITIG